MIGGEWLGIDEETAEEFRARVVTTIEQLIDDHPGERIAVVCHGGVINSYLCHVLGTAAIREASSIRTTPASTASLRHAAGSDRS